MLNNKMNKIVIILIFVIIYVMPIFGKMNSPEEFFNLKEENDKIEVHSPFVIPIYSLVRFYQIAFSPIKQDNCQMYPSCSHYCITCFKKHGIIGILMTVDRLNRCGHDLQYYEKAIVGNRIKYFDPVKENK